MLLTNNSYALDDGGKDSDNEDKDPLIKMAPDDLFIELTVDSTRGTSAIRYTTPGYFVDIYETSGEGADKVQTFIEQIYIPEANFIVPGAEGLDTHRIPLYSMELGASIESLSSIPKETFEDLVTYGNMDLVFNARIGILVNGILQPKTYDFPGDYYELLGDYGWSQIAINGFNSRLNRLLELNPIPRPDDPVESMKTEDGSNITSEGVASSVIGADNFGAEKFDVLRGIPSSESLYVNIGTDAYKMDYAINTYTGDFSASVTVSATVTYVSSVLETDAMGQPKKDADGLDIWRTVYDTQVISQGYDYIFPYTFYDIEKLGVYGIADGVTTSRALGSSVNMLPSSGYRAPSVSVNHLANFEDHINYQRSVNVGNFTVNSGASGPDLYVLGKSLVNFNVRNDYLSIDGEVLMDSTPATEIAPTPVVDIVIPFAPDVLFDAGNVIPDTRLNGTYSGTTVVHYDLIESVGDVATSVMEDIPTNDVVVHTPVVCEGSVFNDLDYEESINVNSRYMSVILGKETTFGLSTEGTHLNIPGYGENDYTPYTTSKQVRFPFDVYMNTTYQNPSRYLPANTWCQLPLTTDLFQIYVPTWVDEGFYSVEFRAVSLNATNLGLSQRDANYDSAYYVATDVVDVEVKGRLYGFTITDINDYPDWEGVFREDRGDVDHSDDYYYSGLDTLNGPDTIDEGWTIPIIAGSHPNISGKGPLKTGYGFKFELETIGDYDGNLSCISIKPNFTYMSYDGSVEMPVDLYYSEYFNNAMQNFVKIDNLKNRNNTKYIILGDDYRNVPQEEIADTANILGMSVLAFKNAKAKLGWFDWLVLSRPLRTFVGNLTNLPASVDPEDVLTSVQHWYGEYYLPDDLYAVSLNYNVAGYSYSHGGLDGNEDFWLRDGYIVVNFDIVTVKDGDFGNPILSYEDGQSSMWEIEGYVNDKVDSHGVNLSFDNGDVILYDINHQSSEDYMDGGTH